MRELERMTQFKAGGKQTGHLMTYPVLMVHDVCGYDEIIVGDDQSQHLELAKLLITRYNKEYGTEIKIPIANPMAGRIMSLMTQVRK